MPPPLGWIPPADRTPEQAAAHAAAVSTMPRFAMPGFAALPKGESVRLYQSWSAPAVVSDVGFVFTRFRQFTGSCFPVGTPVLMADGSERPIEDIHTGDIVRSAEFMLQPVEKVFARPYDGDLIGVDVGGGPSVWATPEHPFLTPDGYTAVGKLVPGNMLPYQWGGGNCPKIQSLPRKPFQGQVYNLEVAGHHSYIAGGLGVHNCVGVGGGAALFSLIAVQRLLAENPTKAILPWWPLDYGISRQLAGMRGQGSGSFGSTFAKAVQQGVLPAGLPGLPTFREDDGLILSERLELEWSDGARIDAKWIEQAKVHPVGTAAELHSPDDCEAALVNGYPITIACDQFVGRGSVQGSGADACVVGRFDNSGGHQTSLQAVWHHPSLGRLFLYANQWDGSTYPKDPSGAPECSLWIPEAEVDKAINRLSGELYAFSHLNWFPSQPEVLSWFA